MNCTSRVMLKALFVLSAIPLLAQTLSITKPGELQLLNADAKAGSFKGKTSVQLNELPGEPKGALAIVKGSSFHNGTIEFDVAGQVTKGASPTARGFVGIAFRVAPNAEKFEYFYIRPTNGRATEQVQRIMRTQRPPRIRTSRGSALEKRSPISTSRTSIWSRGCGRRFASRFPERRRSYT